MKNRHPDREEIFEAIKSGANPFADHLAECETCAQLFEMLKLIGQPTDRPAHATLPGNLYDLKGIALRDSSRRPKRSRHGKLIHDSWANIPPVQLRGSAYRSERRVRFEFNNVVLELVIERTAGMFELVARAYENGAPSTEYLLQVGRRKLIPENHGCFYWMSDTPPRKLTLWSPETRIELGSLAW